MNLGASFRVCPLGRDMFFVETYVRSLTLKGLTCLFLLAVRVCLTHASRIVSCASMIACFKRCAKTRTLGYSSLDGLFQIND